MDKKDLQNISLYMIPFGLKNILPIIALPIFTRYITAEEFGLYALALFFGTLSSGIVNLGLPSIFERTFFEINDEKRKAMLWSIQLSVISLFTILATVIFSFPKFIAVFFFSKEILSQYLLLGFTYITIRSLNFYFLLYYKNYENPKKYSYVTVLESLFTNCFSLILVVFYSMGIKGLILGQCLGAGVTFFSFFFYIFFPFKKRFDYSLLRDQLRLSLPLTPRIFFGVINTQFDRYMLGLLSSLDGVGVYDISQKLANTSFLFLNLISNIFSPNVFKKFFSNNQIERDSIGKYLTPFFYLSTFFSLVVGMFSYEILTILTTKSFHKGAPILSMLSISYAFYFFGKQPQLLYAKKTWMISAISFSSIILNIILNIPFIHFYGIYGAAIATTLSSIITNLINFYYSQKYSPINWENKIFILLSFIITAILIVIVINYMGLPYFQVIFIKIILLTIYIGLGVSYGYFSFNKLKKKLSF